MRITALAILACMVCLTAHAATDVSVGLEIQQGFRLNPDITYLRADNVELKLDVIAPVNTNETRPVLLYIHGGGWMGGSKDRMYLHFIPSADGYGRRQCRISSWWRGAGARSG